MPRKGTRLLFERASIPVMSVERKAAPVDKVSFKGKKRFCDQPLVPIAKPAEAAEASEAWKLSHGEFYSKVDQDIAMMCKKKSNVRLHSELSPAEVAKMSRKIGKEIKFYESLKDSFTTLSDSENEGPN